ncbi:MAG: hypothetical protein ACUVTZ_14825 [Armatimonadota bacterium]
MNKAGETPLSRAIREGHADCVELLRRYGAKGGMNELHELATMSGPANKR